jgi:site-specific recombinase XerC
MVNVSRSEVAQLLAAVDLQAPMAPRDYLLVVLGYHTGLRVSELAGLNVGDVALHGQPRDVVWLRPELCKGHKSREVPLNATAQMAVRKLLAFNQARGFPAAPDAALFVTRHHTRLAVRSIQFMVAGLREKAGFALHVTPHSLRHGFATEVSRRSGNLLVVQQLLGHKHVNTVEVYAHPSRADRAQAVQAIAYL